MEEIRKLKDNEQQEMQIRLEEFNKILKDSLIVEKKQEKEEQEEKLKIEKAKK
jgi:hypothetical protein